MITLNNFSDTNRSMQIGDSFYRICKNENTGYWYIFENYNSGESMARDNYISKDLQDVIDRFNNIRSPREIVSKAYDCRKGSAVKHAFCPSCGARMDGEGE